MDGSCSTKKLVHSLFLLIVLVSIVTPVGLAYQTATCGQVIIHYLRRNADYQDWGLHVWGETSETVSWESPLVPDGQDEFGIYWLVWMNQAAESLNYIIHKGDEKDPGPDQSISFAETGCEIWQVQGLATQHTDPVSASQSLVVNLAPSPQLEANQVIVHYRRVKEDYDGWGLHVWGPTTEEGVTWTSPLLPDGQDEFGIYWIVEMEEGADKLNYIVHKGDEKDPGPDQSLEFSLKGNETWLIEGSGEQFGDPEIARQALVAAGVGDIRNKAQAYWLTRETIAWPVEFGSKASYTLYHDPSGAVQVTQEGLRGGKQIQLEFVDDDLSPQLADRYPHLANAIMLKIPDDSLEQVPEILRGQFAITVTGPDGSILGATSLQIPGVLDDIYANEEALGIVIRDSRPTLRVWAPTAKSVTLHLYPDSKPESAAILHSMSFEDSTGIWEIAGDRSWMGMYYLYDVEIFIRQEGKVVYNLVTDPYSLSLSVNSQRSQIIDLSDAGLRPDGWNDYQKPILEAPEDIVLYELHIRDFSAFDESVLQNQRGTYLAFTNLQANSVKHLKRLADAGLTHVHLLPAFDVATINEDKSLWRVPDFADLSRLPADSEQQQSVLSEYRGFDGYNWGYDPFHYSTPEGSYSTNPDGPTRILEFRQMVQALNRIGLRVVMDVVYNHTNASGQSEKSVLDKIVPGYYHRLDSNGNVSTSTCCANTATEHAMMEKLMIDSLLVWARDYKVDGFRFDLMGHHMRSNMLSAREAIDTLTLSKDGVDGKSIYFYGEGWDFGEVANNARGINATQYNLAGTGIGTFNDRLRDAARGGNPFGGLQEQGFINGLYTDPNEVTNLPEKTQLSKLLELSDQIRVSLAGNLANYVLENADGRLVTGSQIGYNGNLAGYAKDPQENIVYVSSHDNETLFDAIQYKAPLNTSIEDRVRMQNLGLSLVALSQGVPFFHAGSELLRSKSLDRDSYDSGDWFNRLDLTYQTNNWAVGLPPQDKNGSNWSIMKELLSRPELKPTPAHIQSTIAHFEEMLRIRKSSPLFRLRSEKEILERVVFHNTGTDQTPGLIVMSIADSRQSPLDENYEIIVVLFNGRSDQVKFTLQSLQNADLQLHPIQQTSADSIVRSAIFNSESKTFTIPPRTTAVFVGRGSLENSPEILTFRSGLSILPWLVTAIGTLISTLAIWRLTRRSGTGQTH